MLKRIALITAVLSIALAAPSTTRAADWPKVGDATFSSRQAVTIENPANADSPAIPVYLKFADLKVAMPNAAKNTVIVTDDAGAIIPFQAGDEWLAFVVPAKAHEKKTAYIYSADKPIETPKFEAKTSTDSREAYRSFENEYQAFRIEVGDKAKTTGLAVDLFGKTKEGRGVQLKTIYSGDYHKRQPWGIDTMKIGHSPGLGGVYVISGDKIGRTDAATTDFKVLFEGPVATTVVASGPVEVDGKKFTVTRSIELLAGDRSANDTVEVSGDADALKDIKIGIGLRDLPNQTWIEKPEDGYSIVAGDGNQAGTDKLGLGLAFDPKTFVRMQEIEDKANGGHIYVFTPHGNEKSAHIHNRLVAYWDGDGWITTPEKFETAMKQYGKLSKTWPTIQLAKEAEKQ